MVYDLETSLIAGRTKRASKKVNYSRANYELTSEGEEIDPFEDEPPLEPTKKKYIPVAHQQNRTIENQNQNQSSTFASLLTGGLPPDQPIPRQHQLMSLRGLPRLFTEKNYPEDEAPLRLRFTYDPEFADDGSPSIDRIIGRRPKHESVRNEVQNAENALNDAHQEGKMSKTESRVKRVQAKKNAAKSNSKDSSGGVEYEYLVKYKGQSYKHVEYKNPNDLMSMNQSAKNMLRRYLKKLDSPDSNVEELEDVDFDDSYIVVERILDEKVDQELVDLTEEEIREQKRKRSDSVAALEDGEDGEDGPKGPDGDAIEDDSYDKEIEARIVNSDLIRKERARTNRYKNVEKKKAHLSEASLALVSKMATEPYYADAEEFKHHENAYADGFITNAPKKPRIAFSIFQWDKKEEIQNKNAQNEWSLLSAKDQKIYEDAADVENKQFMEQSDLYDGSLTPNKIWQPVRRCEMVLNHLCRDHFAEIFQDPVDLEAFPDYEEVIYGASGANMPMDLMTVREHIESRKYGNECAGFCRDMRKIWRCCKIYNQHGSAIWNVADYMSKLFERLFQAWVIDFKDDATAHWISPTSKPWLFTCRTCDGACASSSSSSKAKNTKSKSKPKPELISCDHCDGQHNISCLTPPLKRKPKGIWHCARCRSLGIEPERLLSREDEERTRRLANMEETPRKWIDRHLFLVKWKGLGYENCTWEREKDIGDDQIITVYRNRDSTKPVEPTLQHKDVDSTISLDRFIAPPDCKFNNSFDAYHDQMNAQFYAQARALQFSKTCMLVPEKVVTQAGCLPSTVAVLNNQEVASVLFEMVNFITHEECGPTTIATDSLLDPTSNPTPIQPDHISEGRVNMRHLQISPPPLTGEYDVVIPKAKNSGFEVVLEFSNNKVLLQSFAEPKLGAKPGTLERTNKVKKDDVLIGVNGFSVEFLKFDQVTDVLRRVIREDGQNFVYFRFLKEEFNHIDVSLTSLASFGRDFPSEILGKNKEQRKAALQNGRMAKGAKVAAAATAAKAKAKAEEEGSEDEASVSSNSDSDAGDSMDIDDNDNSGRRRSNRNAGDLKIGNSVLTAYGVGAITQFRPADSTYMVELTNWKLANNQTVFAYFSREALLSSEKSSKKSPIKFNKRKVSSGRKIPELSAHQEFSSQFCGVEIGDSSDDGGPDEAYFMDNYRSIAEKNAYHEMKKSNPNWVEHHTDESALKTRVPRKDFKDLTAMPKLIASVMISENPPDPNVFKTFPTQKATRAQLAAAANAAAVEGHGGEGEIEEVVKRGARKVEQLDKDTLKVLRVFASIQAAATFCGLQSGRKIHTMCSGAAGFDAEKEGDTVGGFKWKFAAADATVTKDATVDAGRQRKAEYQDKLYEYEAQHAYNNSNSLRDYQIDGLNWMAEKWYKRQSAILADEMGLGKTVQIVTLIEHLYRVEKIEKPFLIVVPLSTLEHWRREFAAWTDLNVCIYHDSKRQFRDLMREYEWYFPDRPHNFEYLKYNVLVTTYDTLISDFDVMQEIPFRTAIVDEAHRLRNKQGKLLECMVELSRVAIAEYGFQLKVLITGTPLQNNIEELWVLLNYIEPVRFPDYNDFFNAFGKMQNKETVDELQKKIMPYMLRRVKEDVAKDIPSKEETLIDVELTRAQKQYYRAIFEKNYQFLAIGGNNAPKLQNIQMELRKCCNHPYLLANAEERERSNKHDEIVAKGKPLPSDDEVERMLTEHGLINSSGKMVLLDKLLPKLKAEGHKILIFSQMVKMLNVISDYCDFRDYNHERLDGSITGNLRQKAIDRFNTSDDSFLFLLSTRAGGVGINLTSADICIIFDSDWNPQNDVQAQARCHRIGQTKDVMIYRLITSRSFEQEMFDRASKKLGLEQAVLGTFQKDDDDGQPTSKELETLLKQGAYALMENDNDDAVGEEFVSDTIDSILAKRTRTRVVEGAKTSSWLNKSGHKVTKSKFASEGGNLDVDDPNFWNKVMPDYVTTAIVLQRYTKFFKEYKHKKEETLDDEELEVIETKADELVKDVISVMKDVFEKNDDGTLEDQERTESTSFLLKISVDSKLFSESQRESCKKMLIKLEGARKRQCRVDDQDFNGSSSANPKRKRRKSAPRAAPGTGGKVKVELSGKKRGRPKSVNGDRANTNTNGDGDGSDSSTESWEKKKKGSRRGRKRNSRSKNDLSSMVGWGAKGEAGAADGTLAWPTIPLKYCDHVLTTLLLKLISMNNNNGNYFSEPVDPDIFPDYYQLIEYPMDYGNASIKKRNGAYKGNTPLFQKDVVAIYQNAIKYNEPGSGIAKESARQLSLVPKLLLEACVENDVFLSEGGEALELYSENEDDDEFNLGGGDNSEESDSEADIDEDQPRRKRTCNANSAFKKELRSNCKECENCLRKEDCGKCEECSKMIKFGGDKQRKKCLHKKCLTPKVTTQYLGGNKGRPAGWRKDGNHVGEYAEHLANQSALEAKAEEKEKENVTGGELLVLTDDEAEGEDEKMEEN